MNISFMFNDISKKEIEEIKREVDTKEALFGDKEKELQKKKNQEEFNKILIEYEKKVADKQKRIDQSKVKQFREVCKSALYAAKDFELNIEIKEKINDLYGSIKLEADCIMLLDIAPKVAKKRFCQVLEAADEILINSKDNMVEILLNYNFV